MISANLMTLRFYAIVFVIVLLAPIVILAAIASKLFDLLLPKKSNEIIAGEVAVITGSAKGLGKEIAIQLAKRGCKIAIVDINEAAAIETSKLIAATYQVQCKAYKTDISSYHEVQRLQQQISSELGATTILVNNAGLMLCQNMFDHQVQETEQLININLKSHYWTNKVFLADMKQNKRGYIVAISSIVAFLVLPFNSEYACTKSGVAALMRALRYELIIDGYSNIHTTTVFPSFLNTNEGVKSMYDSVVQRFGSVLLPTISGEVAARRIVEGMLRHQEEIVIPQILSIIFKIMGNIRTKWITYFTTLFLRSMRSFFKLKQ